MNIKSRLLYFTLILISCNDNYNISELHSKTEYDIKKDSIFIYDTTGKSQSERLNKLIEISCLRKFDESRNEFIESSSDSIYNVSPIIKKGKNYSYEVTSEVYPVGIKYNCIPIKGEYTMDVIGEKSIVDLYYKKIKLLTKWDNCEKIDGNESCNALKKIEVYPINTFFKFDYIKMENGLMHLSYFRKNLPEMDLK